MSEYFYLSKPNPSSTNVESYFKDIKTLLMDSNRERLRIDDFLIRHITQVKGCLKLAISDLGQHRDNTPVKKNIITLETDDRKSFEQESVFLDVPSTMENWKGQMKPKSKKPKSIHILKNGSVTNSYVQNVDTFNTCAFDSIFQSLAIAYVDRPHVKKHILENKDVAICQIIQQIVENSGDKTELYRNRTKLLLKHFRTEDDTFHQLVNCECNTSKIIDHILYPLFYSTMRQKKCTNERCSSQSNLLRKCQYLPINIDVIKKDGISALSKSIKLTIEKEKGMCSDCGKQVRFHYYLSSILFIETTGISQINLTNIPVTITVKKQKFSALAVIEYIPGAIGHYRSWCYRKSTKTWECFDDLQDLISLPSTEIIPHNLIYTL